MAKGRRPRRLIPTGPVDKLDRSAQARVQALWAARRIVPTGFTPEEITTMADWIMGTERGR